MRSERSEASLRYQIRRRKRAVERLNPVADPARYVRELADLADLEAKLHLGGAAASTDPGERDARGR